MYPNNTILANLVKDFGDNVMVQMTLSLFATPLFSLVIYIAGVVMFLFTALSIHRRSLAPYIVHFWLGFICCVPVNGKPFLYVSINTISTLLSTEVSKITHKIFANGKTVPPGFVFNSLMRAATTKITNPSIQKDVHFILDNCIPDVKNKDGVPLSAADLFAVSTKDYQMGGSSFAFNFDTSYLRNREFEVGTQKVNCFELLTSTIIRMRSEIAQKRITTMPPTLYVGANNGENIGQKDPVTTWDYQGSGAAWRIEQMATNLAQANSIQSLVLNDYLGVDLSTRESWNPNMGLAPSIAASKEGLGTLSSGLLNSFGTWNSIFRSLNIDHFYDNAKKLSEMNEKIKSLPYTVAFIQSLLKVVLPIICISVFFGTWRFVSFWASAWVITLFTPWFFYISRLFSNTIILYANKIGNTATAQEVFKPAFLENGVNFDAAANMLDDTSRAMNSFLSVELGLWGAIMMVVPVASFFVSHGKAGAFADKAKGAAEGFAIRAAGNVAVTKATPAAAGLVSKVPMVGPAMGAGMMFVAKAGATGSSANQFKDYFGAASKAKEGSAMKNNLPKEV